MRRIHQAQVVGREDVGPAEPEHQEDLRGPAADALDGHQLPHHLLIGVLAESLEIETAVEHVRRQVVNISNLRPAESGGTYLIVGQRHHTVEARVCRWGTGRRSG